MQQVLKISSGVTFESSEQHVELRELRQARDIRDTDIFIGWIKDHEPFCATRPELISLSNGIVGDDKINCDTAVETGINAMNRMVGMNFADIHLKRTDKVLSLGSLTASVKVHGEEVIVNTLQLFNRIICTVKTDEELAACFEYELAPRPPALFDESLLMRKSSKAVLCDAIESIVPCDETTPVSKFVIDGGYLLHRIVWMRPATYNDIYKMLCIICATSIWKELLGCF